MFKSNKKLIKVSKNKSIRRVYLDNASGTEVDKRILKKIFKVFKENYYNPNTLYEGGYNTKKLLEESRRNVANILGANALEIIFTSCATESNNLAITGYINKIIQNHKFKPHIITTNIEHSSVLEVCKYLEKTNLAEITFLEVENNGIVNIEKLKKSIKKNTVLISIIYANNEIGTIQPIREIAKEIRHYRKKTNNNLLTFHTDATQAINYLPINVEKLGVDLLSFNASKIYGPRGIGVLYKKRTLSLESIIKGGNQEFGLRAGTENVFGIYALSLALNKVEENKEKEIKRLILLRDYFIQKLLKLNLEIIVNGDLKNRLPNNVNITIEKIPSDLIVIELSNYGIYVSEKSACKSGEKKNSYVLEALYGNKKEINSLRFSLGKDTKKEDLDYAISSLSKIFKKLKKWYN